MARSSKVNVTKAMAVATAAAVRLLQNPETREQLLKAGSDLSSQLKSWYSDKQAGRSADSVDYAWDSNGDAMPISATRSVRMRRPAALFAHDRLERRTVKLASTLDVLRSSVHAHDSRALDGVDEAIMRIHVALRVAENLPVTKRMRAYRDIGATLNTLESAIMDAALGTGAR